MAVIRECMKHVVGRTLSFDGAFEDGVETINDTVADKLTWRIRRVIFIGFTKATAYLVQYSKVLCNRRQLMTWLRHHH